MQNFPLKELKALVSTAAEGHSCVRQQRDLDLTSLRTLSGQSVQRVSISPHISAGSRPLKVVAQKILNYWSSLLT